MQVLCGTMNGKVTAKLNKVLLDMIKHPHRICNTVENIIFSLQMLEEDHLQAI